MLSSWVEFRVVRHFVKALVLAVALVCALSPASAKDKHSSPADLQRFLAITRTLEATPLNDSLKLDREWALEWLADAPDVSVTVCTDPLGNLVQSDYPYAGEILFQYMFSMAASIIEHPETANDQNAQQLAGVESALKAYASILRDRPLIRSPALEGLLEAQAKGELPDVVRKAFVSCMAKDRESGHS